MEVAGLIIGGVGIAALFDTCINAFEYVEVGKRYGSEYQKAALRISLLQLRLSRWADKVSFQDDASGAREFDVVATPEQVDTVRDLLGTIQADFEDAERASQRYKLKSTAPIAEGAESNSIEVLTSRVRTISLRRQKHTSLKNKTIWALQDQKKFKRLIEDLQGNINDLIDLFPTRAPQQRALAVQESQELIQPSEVEEPIEEAEVRIATLETATAEVDDVLHEAVKIAAANAAANATKGDRFTNFTITDKARVEFGDYIANGHTSSRGDRPSRTADQFSVTGEARVKFGDNYGGSHKGVFDD